MSNEKLLRGNVTILAAYPEAFADPMKPTSAELNDQFVWGTNEDAMVFNISCSLLDDGVTLNKSESETDDTRTICDVGQVQNPTFKNYEASLDSLRDSDVDAKGVFNIPFNLFKGADRPFYLYKRIRGANTTPFAVGDDVQIFGVKTDLPTDVVDSGAMLRFGARFKNTGEVEVNYRLEA